MLLVIRKPTTVKGWTISIGVITVVAGAVFGWCQHTTNALGDLATDMAVVRSQVAQMDRRLERVEDALIVRIAAGERP